VLHAWLTRRVLCSLILSPATLPSANRYYWLLDVLDLWKPYVWEFGRLSITHTMMSKRKLRFLVEEGYVRGWDDPRLPTLYGLERRCVLFLSFLLASFLNIFLVSLFRGIRANAINAFCDEISVTRTTGIIIPSHRLHHCARNALNGEASRCMSVMAPLKVTLTNWGALHSGDEAATEWIEGERGHFPGRRGPRTLHFDRAPRQDMRSLSNAAPSPPSVSSHRATPPVADFPAIPERGSHRVAMSKTVYIERSDFKSTDEKSFFGLAPGKTVHLKYAHDIKCTDVVVDASGAVVSLNATVVTAAEAEAAAAAAAPVSKKKARKKGNLHWVSAPGGQAPPTAEVRLYDELFTIEDTSKMPAGESWLEHINPKSEIVIRGVMLDGSILAATAKKGDAYQFERLGYFVVDKDSRGGANGLVFNRTLSLKAAKIVKKKM
jgi:glutaminyl-tRNA synthetase